MNKTIKDHVLPLVGKVEMKGFKPGAIGSVMSLSMKMIKHTKSKNTKKLKMYLAFCIQTWPKFNTCPVKRAKKFADFKHGSMKDNPDEWIKTFNDKLDKLTKGE